jgi:hypothetical protein
MSEVIEKVLATKSYEDLVIEREFVSVVETALTKAQVEAAVECFKAGHNVPAVAEKCGITRSKARRIKSFYDARVAETAPVEEVVI